MCDTTRAAQSGCQGAQGQQQQYAGLRQSNRG